MKVFIPLIFILNSFFLIAQNTLQIDKDNICIDLKNKFEYFHDTYKTENIYTIATKEFHSYAHKSFPNLYKQKFWFRIRLNNTNPNFENLTFKIRAFAEIKHLNLYEITSTSTKKIFTHSEYLNRKINIPIKLATDATYYFEVDFDWTALFTTKLVSLKANQQEFLKEGTINGAYYGFSFLVIVINLLFFFFTKNRFFIYYSFFQITIVLGIFIIDNYVYQLFGTSFFTKSFRVIVDILTCFSSILFVEKALNLKTLFPLYKKIALVTFAISAISYVSYIIYSKDYLFAFGESFYLISLLFSYVVIIYFSKTSIYARFSFAAYTVLFISHILYVLPVMYGYKESYLLEYQYKIGSAIEMIIFLIAIPYRHQSLFKEKENIVQQQLVFEKEKELLLQKKESYSFESFSIKYAFTPREVDVLKILVEGATNKEISDKLHINVETVKYHCSKMYTKTDVKNRTQLISLFNS